MDQVIACVAAGVCMGAYTNSIAVGIATVCALYVLAPYKPR